MRFTLLPDPFFREHASVLPDRFDKAAMLVTRETFDDFADDLMKSVLKESFDTAGGDEGTLWLVNATRQELDAVFNTGPTPEKILAFSQPLSSGLISMVFSTGQALCENQIGRQVKHDKTVDKKTGFTTTAMIAVPFYFAQQCRGIISCVQLTDPSASEPEAGSFSMASMREIERAAAVLTRLFDFKLLSKLIGYGNY
jgi:hypothetical protein